VATVRKFIADRLQTKEPEVSAVTLAFYKKSMAKFLKFLGPAADLDLASITRNTVLEFRNGIAKRNAPATANADLKAIKMICKAAKRDGYIIEDPAEFVETARIGSEQARRPFTFAEIQRLLSVADAEWISLILFGLYTGQRLSEQKISCEFLAEVEILKSRILPVHRVPRFPLHFIPLEMRE